jgi:hypothetical protein
MSTVCHSPTFGHIILELQRIQYQLDTGLLTGHCHLKGYPFKLGLMNSPIYERCPEN